MQPRNSDEEPDWGEKDPIDFESVLDYIDNEDILNNQFPEETKTV